MKKVFFGIFALSAILFNACNNSVKNEKGGHGMNNMNKDTTQQATTTDDKEIKVVPVTYTNVDTKAAASVKEIVDHYLHLKNALVNENGSDAAAASKEMMQALAKVDKSLFTADQKKVYDDIEDDLKEHAEHIGANGGNIAHQREHFD